MSMYDGVEGQTITPTCSKVIDFDSLIAGQKKFKLVVKASQKLNLIGEDIMVYPWAHSPRH